jgi:hypothetical protein
MGPAADGMVPIETSALQLQAAMHLSVQLWLKQHLQLACLFSCAQKKTPATRLSIQLCSKKNTCNTPVHSVVLKKNTCNALKKCITGYLNISPQAVLTYGVS